MYWFWSSSITSFILFFLLTIIWVLGGWLIVTHAFRLKSLERIASGVGVGLLLFIVFSNWLAHFLPLNLAFWGAAVLILTIGVTTAWRSSRRPWLEASDLRAWPLLFAIVFLTLLFTWIQRGLAIFDEYLHLPMISIIAAGDIPPHFYLDPKYYFAYHYSLQVLAASLVRLAGLTPWSAWDLVRAIAIALTLTLGWLWVRRMTRSNLAAYLGTILLAFGGGARWLLLFFPQNWLGRVVARVPVIIADPSKGTDIISLLHHPWVLEGAGNAQFPFAFHNGIFTPAFFILGSTGALPFVTFFLLFLLLPRRRFSWIGWLTWCCLFVSLALSAEHIFFMVWGGIAVVLFIHALRHRTGFLFAKNKASFQWALLLGVSALLAVLQGGFITEEARGAVSYLLKINGASSVNTHSFGVRWPPGLYSAHFGILSLFDPGSLLVLLAELGPALILILYAVGFTRRRLFRQDWFWAGLGIGSLFSFFFPLFFQYGVDRSTTRMPASALWMWVLVAFPWLWNTGKKARLPGRLMIVGAYGITVLGGLVTFAASLPAMTGYQFTYFITPKDTYAGALFWNRLPEGAIVLDLEPSRAVTIFGRATLASSDIYTPLPQWRALVANPDPATAAKLGYTHIYMDQDWWQSLTPELVASFKDQPCVHLLGKFDQSGEQFSLLYDIHECVER
jgi:hypothetical protein